MQLLVRLYMVAEFMQRCEFVRDLPRKKSVSLSRAELDDWVPNKTLFVEPRIANIARIIHRELLSHPRYAGVIISPEIEKNAVDAIAIVATMVHRRYASELAWELGGETLPAVSPDTSRTLAAIMQGEVVTIEPHVDINDLFMLMQQQLLVSLRASPRVAEGEAVPSSFLRPIAALVRSSLLAFYQRNGKQLRRSGTPLSVDDFQRLYREAPITIKESDLLDEDLNV